jgi:hypothetical protein
MKSTKNIIEEAVAETLDATRRRALISRLEKTLPVQRLAMILAMIAFGIAAISFLFDRANVGSLISMVFGGAILSLFTYSSTIRRVIQLRLEEERGKTEQAAS